MRTFDFLNFYLGFIRLTPGSPLLHRYELNEYDGDCRTSRAVFLRLWPFTWAVAVGRWTSSGRTAQETLNYLMGAKQIDLYDADGNLDRRFEADARQQVADRAVDPDDEWQILSALGLDS